MHTSVLICNFKHTFLSTSPSLPPTLIETYLSYVLSVQEIEISVSIRNCAFILPFLISWWWPVGPKHVVLTLNKWIGVFDWMYCDSCHQFCCSLRRKVTVVAPAMATVVSCRSLPADTPVQSHLEFVVAGVALGRRFLWALWFSRRHYSSSAS